MFSNDFFLSARSGEALGWMVLHSLWQATLVGIIAGLLLLAMRRKPARIRYYIANAALAAVLFAALGTFLYYYAADAAPVPTPTGVALPAGTGTADPAITTAPASQTTPAVLSPDRFDLEAFFQQWLSLITGVWLLGMMAFLFRLTGNIGYAYFLKTRLHFPAEPYWQEVLDRLAQKSGYRKTIRLVESALVRTPVLVGHLKPMILFPIGMINRLDPEEAEAILAHELAHVLRHDYLFNIFQGLVEAIFYYHPAVWWLSGLARHEREVAADDLAIGLTGKSVAYAKALVLVQDMAFTAAVFSPAFAGVRRNHLLSRVQHVLNVQQSKNSAMEKIIGTCAILLVIIGIGYTQTKWPAVGSDSSSPTAASADGRKGVWEGAIQNDSVCMILSSRHGDGSWVNSGCFPVSAFSGLPTTEADFTLTRPAGTITFRGKFEGAEGYGRFNFVPDPAFAAWLGQQGISDIDDDAMYSLFLANTDKPYVESIKKLGFSKISGEDFQTLAIHRVSPADIQFYRQMAKKLGEKEQDIDDLVEIKIHGVDQEYVNTLSNSGFPGLTLEQIRDAKIHGLDPDFIRQCRDLGLGELDFDKVMEFKIHDITPAFIRECKEMGYPGLDAGEVVNFKIHDITPAFLNDLKTAGLTNLSAEDALNMRIHGVSAASVAELRKMGFGDLSAEDIVNLHVHEITPVFLADMKQAGFDHLNIEDALNLKIHDVDRDFVREMADAGFKNLSAEEIVGCKIHGVDAQLIRDFNKIGFAKINVEDAVSLKIHEVSPAFIQSMREKGFKDLSLEEYIQLKIQYGDKIK